MNWELITQGLELSVMGILTTFMALGLFIGTILLLRMVFPTEAQKKAVIEAASSTEEPAVEEPSLLDDVSAAPDNDAIAAAISAAVYVQTMLSSAQETGGIESGFTSQAYRPIRKGLGARLEQPRGRWWQPMGDNEEGN